MVKYKVITNKIKTHRRLVEDGSDRKSKGQKYVLHEEDEEKVGEISKEALEEKIEEFEAGFEIMWTSSPNILALEVPESTCITPSVKGC